MAEVLTKLSVEERSRNADPLESSLSKWRSDFDFILFIRQQRLVSAKTHKHLREKYCKS